MLLNRIFAFGFLMSLGVTACGEASFVGKGGKKSDPKSSPTTPTTEVPLVPGTGPETGTPGTTPGNTTPGSTTNNPVPTTPGTTTPETGNPGTTPTTPTTPGVPEAPNGGEPTPDCVAQNGTIIPCPVDTATSPSQN